jgi:hypothetical protein
MIDMAAPPSSPVHPKSTQAASPAKATASVAKKPPAKKRTARAPSTTDSRKVAEILREIQIDGEVLSARIKRLRHRFL